MNQLNRQLTWGLISLQGILLLVDPQARNHIYNTFSAFNSVSIPLLQSFSENMRFIVSFLLIPSFFYPRGWILPKFASLIAYVFFICLHSNLIFYTKPEDIKYLLIQLLILGKALILLVDEMIESEQPSQSSKSQKKINSSPAKVSPEKKIQQNNDKEKKSQIHEKEGKEVNEVKGKGKKAKTN